MPWNTPGPLPVCIWEDSAPADRWVHQIAEDLRTGKVQEVIAALKRLRPATASGVESAALK